MKVLRIFLIAMIWFSANLGVVRADEFGAENFHWQVGEELFYKVRYSFLTVGSLHFQVLEKDTVHGQPVYKCQMHMKSSSAIPFVDLDDIYVSYIDEDDVYSHVFWADEKQKGYRLYTHYDMDYDAGVIKIHVEKRFPTDTVTVLDSTAVLREKTQDGLSLLYYARATAKAPRKDSVSVFAFNEHKFTVINFTGELDDVKAKGKRVDGYYLDGKMKFVGIAGIKEDFKGWFSPDAQSVPLHAKMKAFIGSVRLNLEWWKNWYGETLLAKK